MYQVHCCCIFWICHSSLEPFIVFKLKYKIERMAVTNAYHILHTHTFHFRSSRAKYISNEMFCLKQYSFCKNHFMKIVMKCSWKIRMAMVFWKCTQTHTPFQWKQFSYFLGNDCPISCGRFSSCLYVLYKGISLIVTNNGISYSNIWIQIHNKYTYFNWF